MDDSMPVCLSQSLTDLCDYLDRSGDGQRLREHEPAERLAFDQFHDDVGLTLVRLAVVVNGGDVWVRKRGNRARFTQETGAKVRRIGMTAQVEHFDGHPPAQH